MRDSAVFLRLPRCCVVVLQLLLLLYIYYNNSVAGGLPFSVVHFGCAMEESFIDDDFVLNTKRSKFGLVNNKLVVVVL